MSTTDIRTKANEIIAICDAMDATPPNTGGNVTAVLCNIAS